MAQSLVSTTIPQSVLTDITKQLQDIEAALKPYTVGLSPAQRHEVLKMGDRSVSYADKVKDYISTAPDYLSKRCDAAEFGSDYVIPKQLSPLRAGPGHI